MNAPQESEPKVREDSGRNQASSHQDVAEFYRLQEQFRRAQMELTRERKSHQSDNANASMKIAWLEKEAKKPKSSAVSARNDRSRARRWRPWFAFAVTIGIVGGATVALQRNLWLGKALSVWDLHRSSPFASPPPSPAPAGRLPAATIGQLPQLVKSSDFSSAVYRLDRALISLPGDPETILRAIHSTSSGPGSSVCNFAWNDGQPAIVFDGSGKLTSLSETLDACADAVEKFHKSSGHK